MSEAIWTRRPPRASRAIYALILFVPALFGFDACGSKPPMVVGDGGPPPVDASRPPVDARVPELDAGPDAGLDAGSADPDSGVADPDAGAIDLDGGAGDPDAGAMDPDAGDPDAGGPDAGGSHAYVQVEVGYWHTCVLRDDGAVLCWGRNQFGQLGDGTTGPDRLEPRPVISLPPVAELASTTRQTCARTVAGEVYCWGAVYNDFLPSTWTTEPTPVLLPALSDIVQISAGSYHVCARRDDGHLFCWGDNNGGNLGNGDGFDVGGLMPVEVLGIRNAVDVSAGSSASVALLADGRIFGWGQNNNFWTLGVSGSGIYVPRETAVLTDIADLALGGQTGCVLHGSAEVTCWGAGLYGDRADGLMTQKELPGPTMGLSGCAQIEVGACARMLDGSVRCWGLNQYGRLGVDPSVMWESAVPMTIAGITDAVELSSTHMHACARVRSGEIYCWGNNEAGQLGNGRTDPYVLTPTRVLGL